MFSFLYGKVLPPQKNLMAESLTIKEELREYFRLDNNSYFVSGPSVVTVYARMAVPKNEKGRQNFSINSSLLEVANSESVYEFDKIVDSSASSPLHPMHRYTKSGKVKIEIPTGGFILLIENKSTIGKPILTRVIQKRLIK